MDASAPPATITLQFHGGCALPPFRRDRLLERVHAIAPRIAAIDGRWVFFVRTVDAADWIVERLERLLDATCMGPGAGQAVLDGAIVVTPRPGTISPWSSKATDIARRCGLEAVARIERGAAWSVAHDSEHPHELLGILAKSGLLHDRMTQHAFLPGASNQGGSDSGASVRTAALDALFLDGVPPPHSTIALGTDAHGALVAANSELGLGLGSTELDYLRIRFGELGRDPTDAELMMFAQVNSEHCRHRIFNASWTIGGIAKERSLFDMIRHTQACHPGEVLSAYRDNAAVVRGHEALWMVPDERTRRYRYQPGRAEIVMKVETHNHPTAISPFPGAATGSGGEIRDEAATGRGARSKAGITGFSVSNLRIPGFVQPWERDHGRPPCIASALEIMLEGPIGAAAFNNEFGRPALGGYFRTFEIDTANIGAANGGALEVLDDEAGHGGAERHGGGPRNERFAGHDRHRDADGTSRRSPQARDDAAEFGAGSGATRAVSEGGGAEGAGGTVRSIAAEDDAAAGSGVGGEASGAVAKRGPPKDAEARVACDFEKDNDGRAGTAACVYGYHKPIMIAGGIGNIRTDQIHKSDIAPGARLVVLGGPAMLIGLGGGSASSGASGSGDEALDFASVQRENPEMQRRCQEVIDRCWRLGADNPILSIHDVGAGGLSNALPELVDGAGRGGRFELRAIPCGDPSMSPLEIWCNESQERYVLALDPGRIGDFAALCERERCPWADVGEATGERRLEVHDTAFDATPVSMPMSALLGDPPRMHRVADRVPPLRGTFDTTDIEIGPALERVLRMPAVADKSFLVTIGDRTVGGLVARDQMVGPRQIPVADCAVTLSGFEAFTGEAMAMGERTPLTLLDARAAARMAVSEALTNIASADVASIERVVLSANWMAACGEPGEDANLFDAVEAVAMELCPALGISIPVGKDSLSMSTAWHGDSGERKVVSPVSLIVTAFAPVEDARLSLVPMLRTDIGPSSLLLVDLGSGANRLGGSTLALAHGRLGAVPPDVDRPETLPALFRVLARLRREGWAAAYHDRSDGGLAACVLEMAFAGRAGLQILLDALGPDPIAALFCEEPGAVLQVRDEDLSEVRAVFDTEPALATCVHGIGRVDSSDRVRFLANGRTVYEASRTDLHRTWSETSYRMQAPARRPSLCGRGVRPHRRAKRTRAVVPGDVRHRRGHGRQRRRGQHRRQRVRPWDRH